MATSTIARPRTPASPDTTCGPTPSDLLENKLAQLNSLLWCCHGDGNRWFEDAGPEHLDNVLWIAAELARDAMGLFQACEVGRAAQG